MDPAMIPNPAFEGSEKRLELDFRSSYEGRAGDLRSLSRRELDAVLDKACCCIVSSRSNSVFDSYVLSESSLFVYADKVVLKTCGTTRLLEAVPLLLELASGLGLVCSRCKYSRASFLFPESQPAPYTDFSAEAATLQASLGPLGNHASLAVLGERDAGLQWHIYMAELPGSTHTPTYSLEICMTELCPAKALPFFRTEDFLTAAAVTTRSGIAALLSQADIDDFVFEPCGYSMNALQDATLATIHVTPEQGHSYASFELSGYSLQDFSIAATVAKVAEMFNPGHMTVVLSTSADSHGWDFSCAAMPTELQHRATVHHRHSSSGDTTFHSLRKPAAAAILQCADSSHQLGSDAVAMGEVLQKGPCDSGREGGLRQERISFSSADTTFDDRSCDRELEALVGCAGGTVEPHMSEGCSRCPSPMAVTSMLSPCPLLDGQSTSAIAQVLASHGAVAIPDGSQSAIDAHIRHLVTSQALEDPLYVLDLGCVMRLYNAWQLAMPRVHPFYAVKCNTDEAMIALLAAMGAGFDCASEAEVKAVLRAGAGAERIVYANACKRPKDVRAAAALGVNLTTFDTESELQKLQRWHPSTAALLRIRADDPAARCQLGNKYGAETEHVPGLLQAAQQLGINVAGVSFHVGSGATNPEAFSQAIELARSVFDQGLALGFNMHILDIGGGFCGGTIRPDGSVALGDVPVAVNTALAKHFPEEGAVRVIAEPGRYFAEAAASLACLIIGTRDIRTFASAATRDYWITDGLYGSMNCVLYDHATLAAHPLHLASSEQALGAEACSVVPSTVFGPTCDGLDTVLHDYPLPLLENGDWLVFPNMGAYSLVGACNFNGIDVAHTDVHYVCSAGTARGSP